MANTKMYLRLKVQREVLFLFLYTVLCNLVLFNAGATTGYSSVVLPILMNNTSSIFFNGMEESLFASIIPATEIIGLVFCPIMMRYGRRCNMIISGVIYSLGWSLIASSSNIIQLFIGRALTGVAQGVNSFAIEVYLSEICIASQREVVTVTTNLAFNIGVLFVYFLGFVMQDNWRLIAAFFIITSISFVLCSIFFIYESPMWLLSKGREEASRNALLGIRGLRQETIEFQEEFARMVNCNELTNNSEVSRNCQSDSSSTRETKKWSFLARSIWSKLKSIQRITLLPEVWKPFVILSLYFLFQQLSGLYVITSYTVDIIIRLNITINPFLITVIAGIIQVVGNVITICCSDRIGRRTILIVSGAGISISLGVLLVYLQFFENIGVAAVPLTCIFFYVGFGTFGFFTVSWSLITELYPSKYVNVLGLLTTFIAYISKYIAEQSYPMMVTLDRNITFYFYCGISVISTIFLTIMLPETRGKTKTQIEEAFRGKLEIKEIFRKIEDVY